MHRTLSDIKIARNFSTADMGGVGGWIDIAERNRLSRAEAGVSYLERYSATRNDSTHLLN